MIIIHVKIILIEQIKYIDYIKNKIFVSETT